MLGYLTMKSSSENFYCNLDQKKKKRALLFHHYEISIKILIAFTLFSTQKFSLSISLNIKMMDCSYITSQSDMVFKTFKMVITRFSEISRKLINLVTSNMIKNPH